MSNVCGFVDAEGMVELFNIETGEKLSSFETVFEIGGKRLAISPSGRYLAAASYDSGIVEIYNIDEKSLVLKNNEVRRPQWAIFDNESTLYVGTENEQIYKISFIDNVTVHLLDLKAKMLWLSSYAERYLVEKGKYWVYESLFEEKLFSVPKETFAALDAVFSRKFVYITESTGSVRAVFLSTGKEVWRYTPQTGTHASFLGYFEKRDLLLGFSFNYQKGGGKRLIILNANSGEVLNSATFPEEVNNVSFVDSGRYIVASNKTVYELGHDNNLRITKQLDG